MLTTNALHSTAVFGYGEYTYYSQGGSLDVRPASLVGPMNVFDGNWVLGASAGLNYIRLDVDYDGTFETVLELDFGPSPLCNDDVTTRYAFDDGGAALDIPAAVLAMNSIPEPGTGLLGLLGGVLALRRKRS